MDGTSLIDRMSAEPFGTVFASNKACQTCSFARGNPPWSARVGDDLAPDKRYCLIYEPHDSHGKPKDIAYDGADCEFYEDANAL